MRRRGLIGATPSEYQLLISITHNNPASTKINVTGQTGGARYGYSFPNINGIIKINATNYASDIFYRILNNGVYSTPAKITAELLLNVQGTLILWDATLTNNNWHLAEDFNIYYKRSK